MRVLLLACVISVLCVIAPASAWAAHLYGAAPSVSLATNGGGTNRVLAVDLTGDGRLDLLSSNPGSDSVSLFVRTAAGGFLPAQIVTDVSIAGPGALAATAFDGGSRVLVANGVSGVVTAIEPDGAGGARVASTETVGPNPVGLAVRDFNGDGFLDFAATNAGDGSISVRMGDGLGAFSEPATAPADFAADGSALYGIDAGDMNGDTIPDLVTSDMIAGSVQVWLGDGAGAFTAVPSGPFPVGPEIAQPTGPARVLLRDVDLDGDLDVVTANGISPLFNPTSQYAVSVLRGDGTGALGAFATYSAMSEPSALALADLDQDGRVDAAVVNGENDPVSGFGAVSVLFGSASSPGTFEATRAIAGDASLADVIVADIDQDGVNDLVTASIGGATGRVTVLRGDIVPPTVSASVAGTTTGGWHATDATVTLTATDAVSGVEGVYYTVDGGTVTRYASPFVLSTDGTRTVRYWAVDLGGLSSDPLTITVLIDKTKPTTGNNAVAAYSNSATITLTPTDAHSGIASTRWSLDGGALQSGTLVSTSIAGPHTLRFYSTDVAGNQEDTKSVDFTVNVVADTTPPVTSASAAPAANAAGWNTTPVQVTLSATDGSGSGVATTYYRLNGGAMQTYGGTAFTISAEGTTVVSYWSVDAQGNPETPKNLTVKIDATAPQTTSNAVASYDGSATITLNATDARSGVAATYWALDGGPVTAGTSISTSLVGTRTLEYRSVDVAGNSETTHTVTFFVRDISAGVPHPVTSISLAPAPNAAGWNRTAVQVTLTAVPASGAPAVAQTLYRLGGGAPQQYVAPFTLGDDGIVAVEYWSVDASGTAEDAKSATVRVDRAVPTLTVLAPTPLGSGFQVVAHAADSLSGLASLRHRIDAGPWTDGATATVSAVGTATVTFEAQDVAGNVSAESITVVVPGATSMTMFTSATKIKYGSTVTFSGTLTAAGGTSVTGSLIRLQSLVGTRWVDLAPTARADSAGRYSMSYRPDRNRRYRARFAGAGSLTGCVSYSRAVSVMAQLPAPSLTLSGRRLTVSGQVWPRHAGTVVFEIWRGTRLSRRVTVNVNSRGQYWTRISVPAGLWRVRVTHKDSMHVWSASGFRSLRVR